MMRACVMKFNSYGLGAGFLYLIVALPLITFGVEIAGIENKEMLWRWSVYPAAELVDLLGFSSLTPDSPTGIVVFLFLNSLMAYGAGVLIDKRIWTGSK
jgi:hypothetical protein